jgi:cytochrome b
MKALGHFGMRIVQPVVASAGVTMPQDQSEVVVWDPAVRVGHWLLAVAFLVTFVTEEDMIGLHVWAGYTAGAIVLLRIVWGFIGSRHARFSDFSYGPATAVRYGLDLLRFHAKRYVGHSPAGAAMVFALLISLSLTVVTGMAVYGAQDKAGPLAGFFVADIGSTSAVVRPAEHKESRIGGRRPRSALKETHEFFANLTLWLVIFHIGGVVFASFVHRENLVWAMVSGRKRAE